MGNGVTDHTVEEDKLVYDIVISRLTFLADSPATAAMLSIWTMEVMSELETCFQIEAQTAPNNVVGVETSYAFLQKSIIADIVCCYVLAWAAATATGGTDSNTPPATTFLKTAKAGSAEAEFEQINVNNLVGIGIETGELYKIFKGNAERKAFNYGCIINIFDDCTLAVEIIRTSYPRPFITMGRCGGWGGNGYGWGGGFTG